MIQGNQIGGVLIENKNGNAQTRDQLINLNHAMQTQAHLPLFISTDFEGGVVNELRRITGERISEAAIGASGSTQVAYNAGHSAAADLTALGLNVNFMPIVDMLTNPNNPGLPMRTFSSDPTVVTNMGRAYLKGLTDGGIVGCLKHFPGLGSANVDPHYSLPYVNRSIATLNAVDFVPYRTLISEGMVPMVMVTHVLNPQLDPSLPTSLSPNVVTTLLRNDLKFKGVIISDTLWMGGISNTYTLAQAAVLAVKAGIDLLLGPRGLHEAQSMIAGLHQAVMKGEISIDQINASVQRILELKLRYSILTHDNALQLLGNPGKNSTAALLQAVSVASAPQVAPVGPLLLKLLVALLIILFVLFAAYAGISCYVATRLAYAAPKPLYATPAALGLQFRNVTFPSREDHVQLRGWFIPGVLPDGSLTAEHTLIFVHGVRTNRADKDAGLLNLNCAFARNGLAVLAFDMRCCGESPPAPLSLGYFEQRDVLGAVDFLHSGSLPYPELGRPRIIGGWGVSMGAASLLLAASQEPAIHAIVSDCGFADVIPLLERELPNNSHLPSLFNPGILLAARIIYGINFYAVRPVDVVAKLAPRPILFIHGSADPFVPPENMNTLAAAARTAPNANVPTWLVPDATHAPEAEEAGCATYTHAISLRCAGFYRCGGGIAFDRLDNQPQRPSRLRQHQTSYRQRSLQCP